MLYPVAMAMNEPELELELIPSALTVAVFHHAVEMPSGAIDVVTYVSRGLMSVANEELFLSIRLNEGESASQFNAQLIPFFRDMYNAASSGQAIAPGVILNCGSKGFLAPSISGVAFVPYVSEGQKVSNSLALVLLTPTELAVYTAYGATRVLALLGHTQNIYPYPVVNDLGRPTVVPEDLLGRMGRTLGAVPKISLAAGFGAAAVCDHQGLTLRILKRHFMSYIERAIEQVADDDAVAIQTSVPDDANGCLVYNPSWQDEPPTVIAPEGSRCNNLSGAEVVIARGNELSVKIFEDGFGVLIPQGEWARVKQALVSGSNMSIPASDGGGSFAIEWSLDD